MFEHVIDALFRAHGYRTQTNAVLVGQSGARHEIDVLASRREDLLETRVGVECKNWAQPIDTAVVARARLVRDDLGLGQMVIACPGGATPAARTTAAQAGVTLWEQPELAARLGPAALAALGPAPATARRGAASPDALSTTVRERMLRAEARGPLGVGRGQIRWLGDAWITLLEVRFGCGSARGPAPALARPRRVHPLRVADRERLLDRARCRSRSRPTIDDAAPTLPGSRQRRRAARPSSSGCSGAPTCWCSRPPASATRTPAVR